MKKILIILVMTLLLSSPVFASYKLFKKNDIEVLINTTSTNIYYSYNDTYDYAEVIDPNIKEAKIKYKAKIEKLKTPVAILELQYRNKPEKKFKKSKPYKKNDKDYELPNLIYENGTYYYEFWTEHLTDFAVNSTNYTLQECWSVINGTGNSCIVNQDNYSETFNASIFINTTGTSIPTKLNANNIYIDYNFSSADAFLFLTQVPGAGKNYTIKNFESIRGGVHFNPSFGSGNVTIINANITRVSSTYGLILKGEDFNVKNVSITEGTGLNPLLLWGTFTDPQFDLNQIKITGYTGDSECIDLISGVINITHSRFSNFLIKDGCRQKTTVDFNFGKSFNNITFENWVIQNTGSENTSTASFVLGSALGVENVNFVNFSIINYSLFDSWRTDNTDATFNGLTYDTTILLVPTGLGNTPIVADNQDVTGGGNGKPDGLTNYHIWLVNGAVADYTVFALAGGANTCAAVAGAVGGTCDLESNNTLVANGVMSNYFYNASEVPPTVTFNTPPRMDYDMAVQGPMLSISKYFDNSKIVNSTFFVPSSYIEGIGINIIGSSSGFDFWQNNLFNVNVTMQDVEAQGNYCTPSNLGNFWSNQSGRLPPVNDCGGVILGNYTGQQVVKCLRNQTTAEHYEAFLKYNFTVLSSANVSLFGIETFDCNFSVPVAYQNGSNSVRVIPFINEGSMVGERVWGILDFDSNLHVFLSVALVLLSITFLFLVAFRYLDGDVILPLRLLYLFASFMVLLVLVWVSSLWGVLFLKSANVLLLLSSVYRVLLWVFIILVGYVFVYLVMFAIRSFRQKRDKSIFDE